MFMDATKEAEGQPTGEMYPGIFPSYCREVADSVRAHHVSLPAFPEEYRSGTSAVHDDSTRGNDEEPLALSVTRAAARLLPRWESPEDFLEDHRRREQQRRRRRRQWQRRQEQSNTSQDGARGNLDVRYEAWEEEQIRGAGEQDGGGGGEGPTPAKARNVSGHAAQLLPPPPPPPGELSSAVNTLLTGAMAAPAPASDVFGVKRLPDNVYRGLRKAQVLRGKRASREEDGQEGEVVVGAAKCYVCKLSVAAGCNCGVLALAKER